MDRFQESQESQGDLVALDCRGHHFSQECQEDPKTNKTKTNKTSKIWGDLKWLLGICFHDILNYHCDTCPCDKYISNYVSWITEVYSVPLYLDLHFVFWPDRGMKTCKVWETRQVQLYISSLICHDFQIHRTEENSEWWPFSLNTGIIWQGKPGIPRNVISINFSSWEDVTHWISLGASWSMAIRKGRSLRSINNID